MVRFVHLSDTHLGSRQYMRDDREEDFYDAFREAMEVAVKERVDFIVHSGDLFDTWSPSNRALTEFKNTALKMKEAGIPMYLIMGDHDRPKRTDYPAARIFDFLGIKLMGQDGVETEVFRKDGEEVLIAGISNLKGSHIEQLKEEYSKADTLTEGFRNSILISHQGITGFLIEDACEADYDELPKNYSYLAMGHVHEGAVKSDKMPFFSYSGSTEMKSTREIGTYLKKGKSVNLVTLKDGIPEVKRISLSSVRFQLLIESDYQNYKQDIEKAIEKYSDRFGQKKPLFTVRINGEADKETVRKELSRFDQVMFRPPEFKTDTVEIESKPGMDTASDYIGAYFKDDPETAAIAEEFYHQARQDREEAINWLIEKLEIGGST